MRVLLILGAVCIIAAIYLFLYTPRSQAALALLVAGNGLIIAHNYRGRARKPGGGRPR